MKFDDLKSINVCRLALIIVLLILATAAPLIYAAVAEKKQIQQAQLSLPLPEIARQTMARHFEKQLQCVLWHDFLARYAVPEKYKRHAGLFVTLSRNGKTRACWGSIAPQYPDLVSATIYTTEAALTKEYRYPLIKAYEWQTLKPQVTVVNAVEPIHDLHNINPFRDGLMVRSGGKCAVVLPGETADANYQLVCCKLKAGIAINKPCQIYRIAANVFR